jgi:hypothetical protein
MRKWIVLSVVLLLISSCASLPRTEKEFETELNVHDVGFTASEPETYDEVKYLRDTSFDYGDTACLVLRFGGLQPDENSRVAWGVAVEIYRDGMTIGTLGPRYFEADLNEEERDKYMVRIPLEMELAVAPGTYRFDLYVLDRMTYAMVMDSVEFVLARTI